MYGTWAYAVQIVNRTNSISRTNWVGRVPACSREAFLVEAVHCAGLISAPRLSSCFLPNFNRPTAAMDVVKSLFHRSHVTASANTAIVANSHDKQGYTYDRLDHATKQIRLLKLRRWRGRTDIIKCDIETFEIGKAPPFRALSYEWGPPDSLRQIEVNGALFDIRENLWAFLDMYRTQSQNRGYIWIDQVCINQANLKERNRQVRLMGHIYVKATAVVVWLGNSTDPRLSHISQQLAATWGHSEYASLRAIRDGEEPYRCWSRRCLVCGKDDLHLTLGALTSLSYWRRLWIVQELALANEIKIYLGRQLIHGFTLRRCLEIYWAYPDRQYEKETEAGRNMLYVNGLLAQRGRDKLKIWSVIHSFYRRGVSVRCSKPHDLIYGLLGISAKTPGLRVDYDMPTEEVFGSLIRSLVSWQGELSKYIGGLKMEDMIYPMATLALCLGVPQDWCKILHIDRMVTPKSAYFNDSHLKTQITEDHDFRAILSSFSRFLRILSILRDLGLPTAHLSLDDILVVMARAIDELRGYETDEISSSTKDVLAFYVSLTCQAKPLCTYRKIPFQLPHIPLAFHRSRLNDAQLEHFMVPQAELSSTGVPASD